MSVSNFIIYGLVDPRNAALRYVGLSSSGLKRPNEHILPGKLFRKDRKTKRFTPCQQWCQKLNELGLKPEIVILEECQSKDALNEAEIFHIAYLKSIGCILFNVQLGGYKARSSGWKFTEEQRQNCRIAQTKFAVENPEIKQKAVLKGLITRKPYVYNAERSKLAALKASEKTGKKVIDNNGTIYKSIKYASDVTGISYMSIGRQCKGIKTEKRHLSFEYLNKGNN